MAEDLGLSTSMIFGQLSLALFFGGLAAPLAGRMVDRYGGRLVLTLGSLASCAALCTMAAVGNLPGLFLGVLVIELAGMFVLYDPAFAALTQIRTGAEARRAIGIVTLMGGFASTIFWPLVLWLTTNFGWQTTWVALGLMNLMICAPLHWLALDPIHKRSSIAVTDKTHDWPQLADHQRRSGMVWTTIALSLAGFFPAALMVLLEVNATDLGHSVVAAAIAGALIGPAKTAGRLSDMVFGQRLHPQTTAAISLGVTAISFAIVAVFGASFAGLALFAILFGLGDGLRAIIRGALPLVLFGDKGYGERLGWINIARFSLNAGAPYIFALTTERAGASTSFAIMGAVTLAALIALFQIPKPQEHFHDHHTP